uniref:antA/AntB antirepressor family protein n=1 Tax=Photorhabdus sp. RM322S TaxID=3342825 RepID=UPI0036DE161E
MNIKKSGNSRNGYPCAKNQEVTNFIELLPVTIANIGGQETQIVSAKKLHTALGVGRDFSTWIKNRIEEYRFKEGVDYLTVDSPSLGNQHMTFNQQKGWHNKSNRGGDRRSKDYNLSLNMGKELGMVERTEQGRAIRQYFIHCEEELHKVAPQKAAELRQQLKARIIAANYFKPMCAALELARKEQGKVTLAHHYTTESNMISRLVLGGLTAKQWAQTNNITGEPRNSMNTEQLEHLSYLEQSNITLIELGWDYHQRKAELIKLSQRWLAKRMEASQ